ncbi:hypothetical protein [Rhizobium binxianense]
MDDLPMAACRRGNVDRTHHQSRARLWPTRLSSMQPEFAVDLAPFGAPDPMETARFISVFMAVTGSVPRIFAGTDENSTIKMKLLFFSKTLAAIRSEC